MAAPTKTLHKAEVRLRRFQEACRERGLRVNLIGLDGEGLKEITKAARIEDRNHFEVPVPHIYELALAILNNENRHESWFSEFLGESPSGHFTRADKFSSYVSKFFV